MQLGCDPVELERLVPWCTRLVRTLERTEARLARTPATAWTGPAARRWWSTSEHDLRPRLRDTARGLERATRQLQRQADDQRRASLGPVTTRTVVSTPSSRSGGDARWVGWTGAHDARLVVVLVPGVGTDVRDRAELQRGATALHTELAVRAERGRRRVGAVAGAQDVAVVSWLGYDPPDHLLGGLARGPASDGARQLAAEVASWRADGARRVVLVGHSYGALVVAGAAARADPDELVLLGAPGLGVGHPDELQLGEDAELWVAAAAGDPISWLARAGLVHGPDPLDGGRRLDTSRRGHSAYLEDPVLLEALARLATRDRLRAG